ncbi:aldo/keto reductase [Leptospirillum ferrooxidans]|uniref:Putative aldo/keto reductase n=1 Tax=Leptospirillum ferrooxidans (strain C2-3) TaxID=1162668 RepID=I0IPE3_LEPFC|nr:aldo/keto reductase [Leptospirillum ferrooxidans]BAM07142.1 putative aldo/keto reductase [Leptospirillum ferrooxidans C2-3]
MQKRHLGRSGVSVSSIGFGLMGLSDFYGPPSKEEAMKSLLHAISRGITFLDTADVYGDGDNERLLGEAVKSHGREGLTIATKCGIVRDKATNRPTGVNGRPEYILEACQKSLDRLGIQTIDLYYLHRVDPSVPIAESMGAMAELVQKGMVRHVGLSEANPSDIRKAHKVQPIAALQNEYSLVTREIEIDVLGTCRELGIGLVAYSPLGRGLITGSFASASEIKDGDVRKSHPRFQSENLLKNKELAEKVREMATRNHMTPAQLALSWILAQGPDIVPIPGSSRISHIDEFVDGLAIPVPFQELVRLTDLFPLGIAKGLRYPEEALKRVYMPPAPEPKSTGAAH